MSDLTAFIYRYEAPADPMRAVTLLLLHGTGGTEESLLPVGRALLPGAGLLSPRGRVLEGGAPRFFRRLAEGVFDIPDLIARAEELARFVAAAAARFEFDPRRVVAVGYSNGANAAGSLLLLHPGVLAGAVLLRPMVPLLPERAPDLAGVPVFLAGGRRDPIVPPAQSEELAELLRRYGASVTLRWHEGGHELGNGDLLAARAWLDTAFAPPAAEPESRH